MPRNSSGTYTLPIGAFAPLGLIKSSDHNANYSDLATALTQSLATTGVSAMSGPFKAAAGSVGAPSISFANDVTTGFWLPGAGQIGWAAAGAQGATFNSDKSVTWAGAASWAGAATFSAAVTINGALVQNAAATFAAGITFNGTSYTFGAGAANALWAGLAPNVDIECVIDGGGTVILGGGKGQWHVPCSLTINNWHIIADQSGSIVVDIRRAHNAVPSSSIVGGGNAPTLSAAQGPTSAAPSGWTATTLVADDYIDFNVTGTPSGVTRVTVVLSCSRTSN